MENVPTDTDAGPQSTVGVGVADTVTRALHETQPSWLQDGYGVRGPQRRESQEAAKPADMTFGTPSNGRSQQSRTKTGCAPTQPQGGDPEATGTWVWGVVDGTCQWIDTTDCSDV